MRAKISTSCITEPAYPQWKEYAAWRDRDANFPNWPWLHWDELDYLDQLAIVAWDGGQLPAECSYDHLLDRVNGYVVNIY